MCMLQNLVFVLVNSQNVTVEKSNITLVFGEMATLKWSLKKGDVFNTINSPKVYWGDRADNDALLLNPYGKPTEFGTNLFKKRLSEGRFVGDVIKNNEVDFELNVTNVQYHDRGQILFKASFESAADDRVFKYIIIALKVEGSFIFISCDIFLDLVLKNNGSFGSGMASIRVHEIVALIFPISRDPWPKSCISSVSSQLRSNQAATKSQLSTRTSTEEYDQVMGG